mgnify:CR=1 FL=1
MANSDLNQIQIFSKVAQLQSFTKAAEALGLEKSTVSTKISQLEARLGIRLLQRTTRSVSLSESGAQYLSYCEQALAALQMGDDFIAGLSQIPTGRLRVSVPQNIVDFILPTVITPFLQQYPKVNLEMIQSHHHVDLITDNFDIVIRSTSDEIQDSTLIYRKIRHSEWALVASAQHITEFGLATTVQALLQQPSVGTVSESGQGHAKTMFHWQGQKVGLKHRFGVNNMNSAILAIKAGLGFGLVPRGMVARELARRELVEISDDISIKPTALYVIYPSRSGQPAKAKAFVDALVQWGAS